MEAIAYLDSDNRVWLRRLRTKPTAAVPNPPPIADAMVGVTVTSLEGAPLAGPTWPLALAPDAATPGDYSAILEDTTPLVEGEQYYLDYRADKAGSKLRLRIKFRAKVYEGTPPA